MNPLEKRIWFRAIKVVYIIAYILSIFAVFGIGYSDKPYQSYDYDKSYVVCNDGVLKGNSYILNKNSIFVISGSLDSSAQKDARKLCAYNKINIGFDESKYPDPIINNYTYVPVYETVGSWWKVVGYIALGLIIVLFSFWLIKGIFYYIVLGSFKGKPKEI